MRKIPPTPPTTPPTITPASLFDEPEAGAAVELAEEEDGDDGDVIVDDDVELDDEDAIDEEDDSVAGIMDTTDEELLDDVGVDVDEEEEKVEG